MRMTKKVLAFVLAVAVLTMILPVGGSETKAAEGMEPTSADDFSYEVRDDGVHITRYNGSATTVVIPSEIEGEKVVGIGYGAFRWCSSLTNVTIPDSVTQIGDSAFGNCSNLSIFVVEVSNPSYSSEAGILYNKDRTELLCWPQGKEEVKIPEGTLKIGNSAFYGCDSLASIIIPNSVTQIGDNAFCSCSSLTNVTIPNSVTQIGNSAFFWCASLTSVTIPNSVMQIGDSAFYGCSSLTNVMIPDSVTYVGSHAFYNCSSLTDLNMSNSVFDIKEYTFSDCRSLTSIEIPNGVATIGDYAFSGCNSLTSINIPDSVVNIKENAFNYCNSINGIVVEKNNANYSSKDGILYNKEQSELIICRGKKESVIIPDSVTKIREEAFYGCSNLKSITIPDSVLEIMQNAFEGTAYFMDEANWEEHALYIDNHLIAVEDGVSNDYVVKAGTRTIASGAFKYRKITNVAIPDSVTTIAYQAFVGCRSLTKVTIPKSVAKIDRAFEECSDLQSIDVEAENSNYSSEDGILYNKERTELIAFPASRTTVVIPNGVLKIGECAFCRCERLANITIPDSVTSIEDYAFFENGSLSNITIPEGMTYIGEYAFYDCGLGDIILPNSMTRIEKSTFSCCWRLENIVIPNSVTYIGNRVFDGCYYLKLHYNGTPEQWARVEIDKDSHIPEEIIFFSVSEDPNGAYDFMYTEKDDGLYITGYIGQDTEITIPNQIDGKKVVGIQELYSSTIKTVVISNGITSIGERAFESCYGLKSIIIPDSVTQIRESAFIGCLNLTNITIPDSVMQIGGEAFYGTGYWDEDANWKDGALYIGTHLIDTNPEIASDYVVKEGTTTISLCDFQYITSLTIPNSVKYLGCEDPSRYIVTDECRLSQVTVYYNGTSEQWNQIVIDESQGTPKEIVFMEANISYGDATGDQIIDMKDVVLLRKYMAEFDYDLNTSTVAVEAGGDVNGDGIFDMKDVVLLRKYIADFDYDTGTSGVVLGPQ